MTATVVERVTTVTICAGILKAEKHPRESRAPLTFHDLNPVQYVDRMDK